MINCAYLPLVFTKLTIRTNYSLISGAMPPNVSFNEQQGELVCKCGKPARHLYAVPLDKTTGNPILVDGKRLSPPVTLLLEVSNDIRSHVSDVRNVQL